MAERSEPPPLRGAWWLLPGRILCGPHPSGLRENETRVRVHRLLLAGMRLFVDLTLPDEGQKPYEPLLLAQAHRLGVAVRRLSLPIMDWTAPAPEEMVEILAALDGAAARAETAYLHCLAGIGRTGTVASCWLTVRGYTAEAAMAEVQRRCRLANGSDWLQSPESEEQREFVHRWPRRQPAR